MLERAAFGTATHKLLKELSNVWAWFLIVVVGILAGCCLACVDVISGFFIRVRGDEHL